MSKRSHKKKLGKLRKKQDRQKLIRLSGSDGSVTRKPVTLPPFFKLLLKIRPLREAIQEIYLDRLDKLSDKQWADHVARAHESGFPIQHDFREQMRQSLKVQVPEGVVERLKSPVTYISTATGLFVGLTDSLSPYLFLPLSVLLTAMTPKLEKGFILGPRWLTRFGIFALFGMMVLMFYSVLIIPTRIMRAIRFRREPYDIYGLSVEPLNVEPLRIDYLSHDA